ncbi:MAG TPA: hypothetical protein VHT31_08490, partial [Candidatus Acidoferrum sp.]|nr:hypothetical protein [Candidatus Acidoferrum sp.]
FPGPKSTSAVSAFIGTETHSFVSVDLIYFRFMSPKLVNIALWAAALLLLMASLYTLNLTLYNLWVSGGPPVPNPEIYRHRANVSFAVSIGFFLGFIVVVWSLVRRRKRRRTES